MATVKNFGFMWERDKVDWGRQARGAKARFEGKMVGNLQRVVDFEDQMGIYVLYDRFEQPVQVGQATKILRRLKQHRPDHLRNRWAYFSWFGFFKVGARAELLSENRNQELRRTHTLEESLNEIEAVLIQVLEPRLNRRGPNWGDAEEYTQVNRVIEDGVEDEEDAENE